MKPINKNNNFPDALTRFNCHVEAGIGLTMEPKPLDDPMPWFYEKVSKYRALGWAQFSAVNVRVQDGIAKPEPSGLLLAAELYLPNIDESHHLRHNGERWIATKITRTADPASFIETREFLSTTDGTPPLRYEVSWCGDPLRPTGFRLVSERPKPNDEKRNHPCSNAVTSNL